MPVKDDAPVAARVIATLPGMIVARADDGREVAFRRISLRERPMIDLPVRLRGLAQRDGRWWARDVELDPDRAGEHERLLALQHARTAPDPESASGVIVAVDGDAVLARLDSGEELWFRAAKCKDFRGHLGLRIELTIAPRQIRTVAIAACDVEKNAELRRELEPKPLAPITWPSR